MRRFPQTLQPSRGTMWRNRWCTRCGAMTPWHNGVCYGWCCGGSSIEPQKEPPQVVLMDGKEGGSDGMRQASPRALQLVPEDSQDPQDTSSIHLTPLFVKGVNDLVSRNMTG